MRRKPSIHAAAILFGAILSGIWLGVAAQPPGEQELSTQQGANVSAMLVAREDFGFVRGEVIVKRTTPAGVLSANVRNAMQLETVRMTSDGREVLRVTPARIGVMSVEEGDRETLRVVEQLRATPGVQFAQPNYIYQPVDTAPNDTRFQEQWHYRANGSGAGQALGGIGLTKVWEQNKGASAIVVAVIDTGILKNHPDIAGSPNLLPGFDMIRSPIRANDDTVTPAPANSRDADPTDPGDAVAEDECGPGRRARPNSWHGTHVAGTIGVGRTNNNIGVAGVNWDVKVLPVRVLGKCGGTTEDIADAIRWAAGRPVTNVPANVNKAKVINLSLGVVRSCNDDQVMRDAIRDVIADGVTVVVSAGNDAIDASSSSPASCDGVITVAASNIKGELVTRYSNFGPAVEIMAPGGDIETQASEGVLSMVAPSAGTYAFYNGTSMAAPHVAGVAALMLSCNRNLKPADILARLQTTALRRTPQQCPKPCGAGLLNALAALPANCASAAPPPSPQPQPPQ